MLKVTLSVLIRSLWVHRIQFQFLFRIQNRSARCGPSKNSQVSTQRSLHSCSTRRLVHPDASSWCCFRQPRIRIGSPIITDISIAETTEAIVSSVGLDHHKISTRSLRYEGATLLAAAGVPAYAITYFGGWPENSPMIRTYAQLGGQMTNEVSRVMSEAFDKSLVESRIRGNTLNGRSFNHQ